MPGEKELAASSAGEAPPDPLAREELEWGGSAARWSLDAEGREGEEGPRCQ